MAVANDSVAEGITLLGFDEEIPVHYHCYCYFFKCIYLMMLSIDKIISGQLLMNECSAWVKCY